MLAEASFWSVLGLLGYTYAGYPALIKALGTATKLTPPPPAPPTPPRVSAVLCAHNEAGRIRARLENLAALDYPAGHLEVLVVSDGSTDTTADEVRAFQRDRPACPVVLVDVKERRGKPHGLNLAVARASGDIVLFADARQRFQPDTLRHLVARLADPRVGAVSGALEIETAASTTGEGLDAYWRLEKSLRRGESALGATIGCTGAVYAIRRALYQPLPEDTVLDDVVVPMRILAAGHAVVFAPDAVAWEPQRLEPRREKVRKLRTLAGNYQMLVRHPGWLLPWRNRAWWQLLSHKYLRLAGPWLLLLVLTASIVLADQPLYRAALVGQLALYAAGLIGLALPQRRARALRLPAGFLFLNGLAAAALWHYLRGGAAATWKAAGAAPGLGGGAGEARGGGAPGGRAG